MGRYIHNQRFAMLKDEHLIHLFKLRLSNERFDGLITSIDVVSRHNDKNENEPFTVRFEFKTQQYGREEQYLIFKRFSIDEWDYIHLCLEELNIVPVSEYVLVKKGEITNLECSDRGWRTAMESIRKDIKEFYENHS